MRIAIGTQKEKGKQIPLAVQIIQKVLTRRHLRPRCRQPIPPNPPALHEDTRFLPACAFPRPQYCLALSRS